MEQRLSGRLFKFGDHVNSDVIIAGRYLIHIDPDKLAEHAFEMLGDGYPDKLRQFDIFVAGRNFGCGSAREQAATAIIGLGIKAVVATSFARTFYRNAINVGLPVIECPGLHDAVKEGDTLTIDMAEGSIVHDSGTYSFPQLPESIRKILELGGLSAYLATQVGGSEQAAG
jgi:3-isopropylmalate/(R)-2-methylmalate dehydratase small subunit